MLSDNIKTLRKQKGLTQEELVIRLNVVRQTVSKWEKGLSVPDAIMLQELAEILETDVASLLGAPVSAAQEQGAVAEQLARINEQLAVKNRRGRRIWKVVGIAAAVLLLLHIFTAVLSYTYMAQPNEPVETIVTHEDITITEGK